MSEIWLNSLIVVVPLLAGMALIAACAVAIFRYPNVSYSNVLILSVAALLCVAPTILNIAIKLPGGGEITLFKEQFQDQAGQIKNDLGQLGALLKGQINEMGKRLDRLESKTGTAASSAVSQDYTNNKPKVVVIYYNEGRKELALRMENFLLQKGYSANAVYTDFTELNESSRGAPGSIAFVSTEQDSALRNEIEKVLRTNFQDVQKAVDSSAAKLSNAGVQIRLF
jgi:hypothetical protein